MWFECQGKLSLKDKGKRYKMTNSFNSTLSFLLLESNEPSPSLFPVFPHVKTSCLREGERRRDRAREGEKALASPDSRLTARKVNWSLGEWLWWPIFNRTTYKCLNVWFLLSYRKMDLVIFFCMANVLGQGLRTGYWVSALDKSEHQSYITQLMS